jgi:hypothetical protein
MDAEGAPRLRSSFPLAGANSPASAGHFTGRCKNSHEARTSSTGLDSLGRSPTVLARRASGCSTHQGQAVTLLVCSTRGRPVALMTIFLPCPPTVGAARQSVKVPA